MADNWSFTYSNGDRATFIILVDGSISWGSFRGRLEVSDNQVDFPSSQGWFKWQYSSWWIYIRITSGDKLEVYRFCTDGCTMTYKSSKNYCCKAEGLGASRTESIGGLAGKSSTHTSTADPTRISENSVSFFLARDRH